MAKAIDTKLLVTIIIALGAIATSYGVMKATVSDTAETTDTLVVEMDKKVDKEDFEKVEKQSQETHDSVIRIETQMEIVAKMLNKIYDKVEDLDK